MEGLTTVEGTVSEYRVCAFLCGLSVVIFSQYLFSPYTRFKKMTRVIAVHFVQVFVLFIFYAAPNKNLLTALHSVCCL